VRVNFQEGDKTVGWGLVRASNTGAVLVMRFEGDSPARVASLRELVETQLHRIIAEVRAGQ
jgi:phosphomannomutase